MTNAEAILQRWFFFTIQSGSSVYLFLLCAVNHTVLREHKAPLVSFLQSRPFSRECQHLRYQQHHLVHHQALSLVLLQERSTSSRRLRPANDVGWSHVGHIHAGRSTPAPDCTTSCRSMDALQLILWILPSRLQMYAHWWCRHWTGTCWIALGGMRTLCVWTPLF